MSGNFYYSIASGSTGNCALYVADGTALLIDMGVSVRAVTAALKNVDMTLEQLDGVVLTHEHIDHVKGLATLTKKYDLPVYATQGTAEELIRRTPHAEGNLTAFYSGDGFRIGSIEIQSLPTPHDAADSVGYLMASESHRFAFVTDLGFMPSTVRGKIEGCDTVVLESNHDIMMLRNGPYPWHLKQRVGGNRGHLSNADCALCAAYLAQHGTKRLILAHLSEHNNTPMTAYRETRATLDETGEACELFVAPKGAMESPVVLSAGAEEKQCCLFV